MGDLGLRWEQTGKVVAENTERINKVETKVEKQEARGDKFENELKKTKEELEELKKSMNDVKDNAIKMSLAEIAERENNRTNVIIHRVSESASSEPSERQAHDMNMLKIIFKELGLSNMIKTERREDIKFIRRIGEKKEQQEARPMKVGLIYHHKKEMLMESAKNLNDIPNFRHITIAHDLTDIQRKEETTLWRKAADQNLAPSIDMRQKGLVMKVVGPRGQRRLIAAPLRQAEEVDEEGRVRLKASSRRREGGRSREQEQERAAVTGTNREPLGSREQGQGNGQGAAAGGGANSREQQEEASMATEEEVMQLRQGGRDKRKRPETSSQSSGSEEEGREKEKGRKEKKEEDPRRLADYPGVRMFPVSREEGEESSGGRSRFCAHPGMMKTTGPPFRSSSSSLLQPRVSTSAGAGHPCRPATVYRRALSGCIHGMCACIRACVHARVPCGVHLCRARRAHRACMHTSMCACKFK